MDDASGMNAPAPDLRESVRQTDHIRGDADAPLVLVKYADFECPDCAAFHEDYLALPDGIRESVGLVFRHFPLVDSHPQALRAAEAVEAAGVQGRFWEMYDLLFGRQEERSARGLGWIDAYAERLELDMERFRTDLGSRVHTRRIWADVRSGRRSGVSSTPGLFVNGRRFEHRKAGTLEEDLRDRLED